MSRDVRDAFCDTSQLLAYSGISSESNREFFLMQIYFFLLNVHVHMKLGNNTSE